MAVITTTAPGVWNAGGTWVGGVPPGNGDVADIDHAVTLNVDIAGCDLDIANAITLTMGSGGNPFDLTGMTASFLGTGTVYMNPGCELKFNSAANLGMASVNVTARGTSWGAGDFCTIDNVGAGGLHHSLTAGDWDCEYIDIHGIQTLLAGTNLFRLVNFDVEGKAGAANTYFGLTKAVNCRVILKNGFTSRFSLANYGGVTFGYYTHVHTYIENIAFGVDRDSNVQANANDIGLRNATNASQYIYARNLRATSATQTVFTGLTPASRLIVDNWGFDGTTGTPGIGYAESMYWSYYRSAAAKRNDDFGVRVTPVTGIDTAEDYYAEIPISIPIATGDNISVAVQARRNDGGSGGMTNDCVEVELDPEGAWFTPDTSAEVLTNADTWYELTCSGAGANAGEGAVRIVLRLMEFAAGDTADFADMTVTVGSTTYTIDFGEWHKGSPIAVASGGGGATSAITKFGGKIG